ncbi:MAG: SCO family protein [Anaerolineae bacterium]|nr:SCO family protein [Anaerolineae bacterium]
MRRQSWLVYLFGLLIVGISLVAVYIVYLLMTTPQTESITITPDTAFNGITAIEPPLLMSDFTLTNQHNEPIRLRDLSGKPILITFGFTSCPDICPFTLGEMRSIHEALADNADDINFVFISVDGERDTPDTLRDYFDLLRVDTFLIGMTGTPDSVRQLGDEYGVNFIYDEADDSGNYGVTHTAGMFLLDENQNWIRRYTYGMQASLIIEDIQQFFAGDV